MISVTARNPSETEKSVRAHARRHEAELKLRVLPRHPWLDGDMSMGMCCWFHEKIE